MVTEQLTIGELAERTGTATSALRYYEDVGLLTPPRRVSGHRRYDSTAVFVVGLILVMQEVGFTLAEIKELMASYGKSPKAWRTVAQAKIAELDERITKATAAKTALEHTLACEHENLLTCPNFQTVVAERLSGRPLHESHVH